jgi:hypothetical protein
LHFIFGVFKGNKRGGDETAYKIKAVLEDAGFEVFMDDSLEGGDDWGTIINTKLQSSSCMVALCSEHFAKLRTTGQPMYVALARPTVDTHLLSGLELVGR